ncbi:hypothetical protein [Pseudarthrobacter sp. H2]|uniref:hypothetical protein n=1 Tax=Pseudarthrobacter sp. H2 TaxID=3418415 RepID=UPI003CF403AD
MGPMAWRGSRIRGDWLGGHEDGNSRGKFCFTLDITDITDITDIAAFEATRPVFLPKTLPAKLS